MMTNPRARAAFRACLLLILCLFLSFSLGCGSRGSADEAGGDSTAVAQAEESDGEKDDASEAADEAGDKKEEENKKNFDLKFHGRETPFSICLPKAFSEGFRIRGSS